MDKIVRESIKTENAPTPKGPYSQGLRVDNFVFVSAQGPFDPKSGKLVGSDIESQTRQTLENIRAVIERAGLTINNAVRMTVFLKNAADFQRMNEVYRSFFAENPPTRTTVEANSVSPGILVTIDAIAYHD
jgi:2-iminobutanoate/2-iminopropanoate deaminase